MQTAKNSSRSHEEHEEKPGRIQLALAPSTTLINSKTRPTFCFSSYLDGFAVNLMICCKVSTANDTTLIPLFANKPNDIDYISELCGAA
jgi:hypothetical protein